MACWTTSTGLTGHVERVSDQYDWRGEVRMRGTPKKPSETRRGRGEIGKDVQRMWEMCGGEDIVVTCVKVSATLLKG